MNNIVRLDFSNWEKEVSQTEILMVVYFWHRQCPWCLRFNPIFDEVANEYVGKIKFAKLDILENPANQEIASNLGIMSTPTLMFICSGRPLIQIVGIISKEDLVKMLEDMLKRYKTCLRQSSDLRNYIV